MFSKCKCVLGRLCAAIYTLCGAEGVFLDVIGTKILILLLYAIHSHLLYSPHMVFLNIEISRVTAEVGGGLAWFIFYLYLPLKVALFFLVLHLIYI
jgi:hypothetical protein